MSDSQIRQDKLLADFRKNKSKYKKIANKMHKEGKSIGDIAHKIGWKRIGRSIRWEIKGASNLILKELLLIETWGQYHKDRRKILQKKRYNSGFNPKLKMQIRLRDGKKCVICESTVMLEIHHIDGDFTNNIEHNLITICKHLHNLFQAHSRKALEHREAIQYVEYINSKEEYFKKLLEWKNCTECNTDYIEVKNVI